MPKSGRIWTRIRGTPDLLQQDRLLLLEEGHCLRDQALSFCNLRRVDNIDTFGASNLSTIVQMVANGLGMALLPELTINLACRQDDMCLMRLTDPRPRRWGWLPWPSIHPPTHTFYQHRTIFT